MLIKRGEEERSDSIRGNTSISKEKYISLEGTQTRPVLKNHLLF